MPPELAEAIKSPMADRLVTVVLLLVIVVLQVLRWVKPPSGRFELDTGPIVAQLQAIGAHQEAFLASFQDVQREQTQLIIQAMERQKAARETMVDMARSLEDHRREMEGREGLPRRRR